MAQSDSGLQLRLSSEHMRLFFSIALLASTSVVYGQTSYMTNRLIRADSVLIRFVGSGDIQKSIAETNGDIPANTGMGVSFQRFFAKYEGITFLRIKEIDVDFTINVASTVDTITAELAATSAALPVISNQSRFGSSILVPGNSGQATYLSGFFYVDNEDKWHSPISGFHLLAQGSNRNWRIGDLTVKASTVALRIALFGELVPDPIRIKNNYSIKIGYGPSIRSLQSDAGQRGKNTFRKQYFGSEKNTWYGTEAFTQLRFGNLTAEVAYTWFSRRDESLAGLTGSNLITSIRFTGGFDLDIKK